MELHESNGRILERLRHSVSQYCTLSIALVIGVAAIRMLEVVYFVAAHPGSFGGRAVLARAIIGDLVAFGMLLPVLYVPFVIVHLLGRSEAWQYRFYGIVGTVLLVLYAALVKYFHTAMTPLGADLFGYSLNDILSTIRGGAVIDTRTVLLFIIPLILYWSALAFLTGHGMLRTSLSFALLGIGLALAVTMPLLPARASFPTDLSYYLAVNKAAYFVKDTYAYFAPIDRKGVQDALMKRERGKHRVEAFVPEDPAFPFLRRDTTEDVLGPFFAIDPKRPPNIVFIMVEGLGKAFSGTNAYLGSFTPFLDELAARSLYWENFLAAQGRTFAALPSILGSLPFGEQGFSALKERMPKHLSVMSILKRNGYRLKFVIGSDPDFDHERMFLKRQGVDVLVGIDDFDKGYTRTPGSSWGYPDREVMRKALDLENRDRKEPFVTFVQTMSMHPSYKVPDQQLYVRRFEDRMTALGFDEGRKARAREYRDIYATVLYADDAIRYFLEGYALLPAYPNTIFIITGDHRLPEIPLSTKIDRFHVPLIIFSPLLRQSRHIASISSHLDIAPSLVAFLRKNYGIMAPASTTWVGTGLDVEPAFRNIHRYPLKHTKTNLIDYISGMYFLNQDTLFTVRKAMDLEPVADERKKRELVAEFDRYRALNDRFIRDVRLIPDSVYEEFRPDRYPAGQKSP